MAGGDGLFFAECCQLVCMSPTNDPRPPGLHLPAAQLAVSRDPFPRRPRPRCWAICPSFPVPMGPTSRPRPTPPRPPRPAAASLPPWWGPSALPRRLAVRGGRRNGPPAWSIDPSELKIMEKKQGEEELSALLLPARQQGLRVSRCPSPTPPHPAPPPAGRTEVTISGDSPALLSTRDSSRGSHHGPARPSSPFSSSLSSAPHRLLPQALPFSSHFSTTPCCLLGAT